MEYGICLIMNFIDPDIEAPLIDKQIKWVNF